MDGMLSLYFLINDVLRQLDSDVYIVSSETPACAPHAQMHFKYVLVYRQLLSACKKGSSEAEGDFDD